MRVGANLQPGQKLGLIGEPEHASLLRALAEAGWAAGAGDVECLYLDDHVRRLHAINAPEELLDRTPAWVETAALGFEGAATVITLGDADPGLFADVEQSRAAKAWPSRYREIMHDQTLRLAMAWTVIACPTEGWARSLFGEPDVERLWEEIAVVSRLDLEDPVAAWQAHVARLRDRARQLDERRLRHASFPRARDGSPGRPPRARALALRLVADVLGPGDRGQPPDRGGLHHPRPFAHRGPCATHRSAALVRLAGGGRLAALRRRRGRGGRCGGGRGVPPDEARRRRRRAQARRGRSGRRRIGGRKARPRVPEQPARREPVVAHRASAAATRTRSRDRPRSTRPGDSQPGSTCRRSTST